MSAHNHLRAAIVIVSQTAFADPSTDRTIPLLSQTLASDRTTRWTTTHQFLPDDLGLIRDTVTSICDRWADDPVNLLLTSGGTGFAQNDWTPEAVGGVLEKKAPGLVHAMLAKSLEITPFAMMSRPVAGVRKNTIVITLPGAPKGANENLEGILKLLPHACLQAAGQNSRAMHAGGVKQLEREAGISEEPFVQLRRHLHPHSHADGHGHAVPHAHTVTSDQSLSNDPSAGPAHRTRISNYPIILFKDALRIVLEHLAPAQPVSHPVDPNLIGYVLAEDVTAAEAVPGYRASIVDGYAVVMIFGERSIKGVFPVTSVSLASLSEGKRLGFGEIARVSTGAPVPHGTGAVVMVEDTRVKTVNKDDLHEEDEVEILTDAVKPGENIREIGSDVRLGEVVLRRGDSISSVGGELGLLASVGRHTVDVYEKAIVGVLSTGHEIVEHTVPGPLPEGQVRDSNRIAIMAAVQSWGYKVVDLGIAKDSLDSLEHALRHGMRSCTLIITTGGVSMGEVDLLKPCLERQLSGTIHFGRVAIKPGKPTTFATVPYKTHNGTRATFPIFSLAGNPASALVTLHLFVLPALRYMSGSRNVEPARVKVVLDEEMMCDANREEFLRAMVRVERDGVMRAIGTGAQRSSRVGSLRGANALLCLPIGGGRLVKGNGVEALLIEELYGPNGEIR